MNSVGMMVLRLSTHSLSRNTARPMIEHRMMGYMNIPL